MEKLAVLLTGMGTYALAIASCSTATSPTSASRSGPPEDSAQSAPGVTTSPTISLDITLTSENEQSGPSAQSGQKANSSVVTVVQLVKDAGDEMTLASINEAMASIFLDRYVSVGHEYRNVLKGYALRAPAELIGVIRVVNDVQAAYPDGNNPPQ